MNSSYIAACAALGVLVGTVSFCFDDIKKDYANYQTKKSNTAIDRNLLAIGIEYDSYEAAKARGFQELCRIYHVLNTPYSERKPGCP
jgi:hypothetical protein